MRLAGRIIFHPWGLRVRLTQRGKLTLASLLLFSVTALRATPAVAQLGSSNATVNDLSTGTQPCNQANNTAATTSATCPPTLVTGGSGSASTSQNSLARTMSANATLDQTAAGLYASAHGISSQNNQFNVAGTSGSNDHLLFHFLTTGPSATGVGGVDYSSYAFGEVALTTPTGSGYFGVIAYGNGYSTSYSNGNTAAGTGYVDFVMPFSSFTGGFWYYWQGRGFAYGIGQPPGLSLSGEFSGMLDAIYAVNEQGQTYGSVDFNTGELAINATPEPASLALLGTGLFCLAPMMRRKFRK